MKAFSKEVKIGIAFLIAIFILYFGINFLKGINTFKPSNSYILALDNVEGLAQAAPVTLNGFQVGLVYSMELDKSNADRVIVHLNMDKAIKIPKGSKFILDVSMLGTAVIEVEINPYTEELFTKSDTIVGSRKKGLMDSANDMAPVIVDLIPKIDSILTSVQALVSNPALQSSLSNVDEITKNLAQSTKQLNAVTLSLNKDIPTIISNMNNITKDFSDLSADIKKINFQSTFNSLDTTMKNFEKLSKQVNAKDNSLGLLLNDRQLYDSINSTLNNASLLLKDVKDNPSRYINVKVF